MLVKVTLQSDADDYRDLLVANLKQEVLVQKFSV